MNWWKKLRRLLGFPGFDYAVVPSDVFLVGDYQISVMTLTVRAEIEEWCDKHFARKNWKAEYYESETDSGNYDQHLCFKFRHERHAMHFKMSWG